MLKELVSLTSKSRGKPIAMTAQDSGDGVVDGVVKASGAEATLS
jgi:lysophosphatidate acyltransferase